MRYQRRASTEREPMAARTLALIIVVLAVVAVLL